MAASFLRRLFRLPGAGPRVAGADRGRTLAESLIPLFSARLPADAQAEFALYFAAARAAPASEAAGALITLFSRVEDRLAADASDPRATRTAFRAEIRRDWPQLARDSELAPVLAPPGLQEAALCDIFLRRVIGAARDVLGAAAGDRLGALNHWLDYGMLRGEPPPFSTAPGATGDRESTGPDATLQLCSRACYQWLNEALGKRAADIYRNAYRRTMLQFGAADGFPSVLGMVPPEVLTADVIGLLRRSQVEQMLREQIALLERANNELREARDTLERRVKDRTQALEHANRELTRNIALLEEARRESDDANQAKSQFLAHISHELRTPLNAIIGFSQMMMGKDLAGGSRHVDYARMINDSGVHLLAIIEGILDTSKIESGQYALNEEPVEIATLVESCVAGVSARLDEAGLRIHCEIAPRLPFLFADRRLLAQMLLNILSNAIKFNRRGGSIRIEAALNDERGLDLAVHDNGIGIAEENIPRVLEPFRQVRDVFVRDPTWSGGGFGTGTGLGLPLVVGMARLHGGEFILRSKLGAGTSAIIRLPGRRLREAGAPTRAAE